MKKFWGTLLCGAAAINNILGDSDMAYMAQLSSELFND